MLKNYIKIAWRNLLKNKGTTITNLVGLIVGMTAALLIWQYVAFEKSYDNFHEFGDDIVRARTDRYKDGEIILQFAAGAMAAGNVLKDNFSEVEEFCKIFPRGERVINREELNFRESQTAFASANFFTFFSFELLTGNPETCLGSPFKVVLSERQAKKYFGNEDPIGKNIRVNRGDEFEVSGIFRDPPPNAHFKYDILLSYPTFSEVYVDDNNSETQLNWDGMLTYLRLQPGTDLAALQAKIPTVVDPIYQTLNDATNGGINFVLQPLKDIHLQSNYILEAELNGNQRTVHFLFIIGGLILFIAWFNYINLATARAQTRAREVGVRKVLGSGRRNLIFQFLLESAILNGIAIILSFALAQILAPAFEALIDQPIDFNFFGQPKIWLSILAVFVLGTLLSGLYPAFILSSFQPLAAINNTFNQNVKFDGTKLRKGLVVLQFATSVLLIAGTITFFQQLSYMQNKDMGVTIDQTLIIKTPRAVDSTYQSQYNFFRNEINSLGAVQSFTASTSVPGQEFGWTAGGIRRWGAPEEDGVGLFGMAADHNFAEIYGMELLAGRYMNAEMMQDSNACMLNEKSMQLLDFESPEAAIGVDLDFWETRLKIVGVIKNFHQQSPELAFAPLVLRVLDDDFGPNYFSVKVYSGKMNQTLATMQEKWTAAFPGNPFDYFFLDDHFNQQFQNDQRVSRVLSVFSGLAIFVSCLGLLALAAFVAQRRTKEIGIRKVLGASVQNIVGLLSKDFLLLVGGAILLAVPIGWYLLNSWLDNYATRINISWWVFALAGILSLIIAFFTISVHAIKAATSDPVEALRNE